MGRFPLYRIAGVLMTVFINWRKRYTGLEHIPEGGFVLAANHVSSLDPFVLGMPLYPRRTVRYMAKAELFTPLLAPAMRAIGTFPVRRNEPDSEAIRTALEILAAGEVVGMFPEGTRARKGLRKKFAPQPHTGTARIALKAGVPLIPAAIGGTDRLLRFGPVSVAFGPPIPTGDLQELPRRRGAEIATERLMAQIEELAAGLAAEQRPEPKTSLGRTDSKE